MNSAGFTVDGDELTVWAGMHHIHVGLGEITDEDVSRSFELLDDIIADRTFVVSVWKGDRMRLSFFENGDKPGGWHSEPTGDHRLVVHSWTGRSDTEKAVRWPGWIRSVKRMLTE